MFYYLVYYNTIDIITVGHSGYNHNAMCNIYMIYLMFDI